MNEMEGGITISIPIPLLRTETGSNCHENSFYYVSFDVWLSISRAEFDISLPPDNFFP